MSDHTTSTTTTNAADPTLAADLAEAVTARPHGFTAGRRHYALRQPTLGIMMMLAPLVEAMGVDADALARAPHMEALRVVMARRTEVCRYIAAHTLDGRREAHDPRLAEDRAAHIARHGDDQGLATLLLALLTADNRTADLSRRLGIDREAQRMERAARAKRSEGGAAVTFGCASVYGTLLDAACERYGWKLDYVLWGVTYTNLRLMLADSARSLYLTADEQRRARVSADDRDTVSADTAAAWEFINSQNWD